MSAPSSDISGALTDVITGILDGHRAQQVEAHVSHQSGGPSFDVLEAEKALSEFDLDAFDHVTQYEHEQRIGGLIRAVLPVGRTDELIALLSNYRIHERTLARLFREHEGNACSSDKSRTVMASLAVYLAHGTPIAFDYTQRYTYHLPTKLLTTHEQIVGWYKAHQDLVYGNPTKYLAWLALTFAPTVAPSQPLPSETRNCPACDQDGNEESRPG